MLHMILMQPDLVNRAAFWHRLSRMWVMNVPSHSTSTDSAEDSVSSRDTSKTKRTPFAICGVATFSTFLSSDITLVGAIVGDSCRASSLKRRESELRKSRAMLVQSRASFAIVRTTSTEISPSSACVSSWSHPIVPLRGFRTSWYVMARKSFSSLRSRWRRRRSARLKRSATKTTVTRTAELPTANGHSSIGLSVHSMLPGSGLCLSAAHAMHRSSPGSYPAAQTHVPPSAGSLPASKLHTATPERGTARESSHRESSKRPYVCTVSSASYPPFPVY
mmetsp:Transcript_31813/g.78494  ORF Transcript_31813/g.78494 Transcript_31813/m.78494 type:complete len:277 (+) Transcript_31813:1608-2438(+)